MWTAPTVADFKAYFTRDFPYGADAATVMDSDIQKALDLASFQFNECFFGTDAQKTIGYELLTAHFLVTSLRNSSQGIAGAYTWLTASKGVSSVNEAYAIPDRIMQNPVFAMMSKTSYGAEYLMLILPALAGQIFTVAGGTQP